MIIKEYIILEPETEEEFFFCAENYISKIIGIRSKEKLPCFKIERDEIERHKNFFEKLEEKGFIKK